MRFLLILAALILCFVFGYIVGVVDMLIEVDASLICAKP